MTGRNWADVRPAIQYHQRTKHSFQSVRRASGGLDWDNRPRPFKEYSGLDRFPLPNDFGLARLLRFGAGVVRRRRLAGGDEVDFRTYASAGALYPIELYVATADGLFHFHPRELALRRLRDDDVGAALGGGEVVVVEVAVRPYGSVAATHVHPYQTERFEVISGRLAFKRGGETIEANAGDVVVVEPGTPHKFWNAGRDAARFRTEVRPALQFESLIETMFSLAADGKTSKKGMPNPLRLAVIAQHHFGDVQLPFPPAWMQRAGLALGAPLGKLLGYRPVYEGQAGVPALAEV